MHKIPKGLSPGIKSACNGDVQTPNAAFGCLNIPAVTRNRIKLESEASTQERRGQKEY